MNKDSSREKDRNWEISFFPVVRYGTVFCALLLLVILIGGAVLSLSQMKTRAKSSLTSSHAQISQRIEESVTLLESLAGLPEFYDPEIPPIEKVKKLDQMSPHFGYLMICYVDADIIVYSDGSEPASLASREYMQQLFSTGQRQVTDSFAAGADGVTLNYTVAVPLFEENGEKISGCLFCAIYFDEVTEILQQSASANRAEATLIGSRGQIMSSTAGLPYGDPVMDVLRNARLFGTTADRPEEQMLVRMPGDYWSLRDGMLYYTVFQRVENTGWDILSSVSFGTVFAENLPSLLLVLCLGIFLCTGLMLLIRRYIAGQMKVVDVLVHSVEELEKKIYHDERPDGVDFNEIIRLTGDGLTDSLTNMVTRSVFLNQAEARLGKLNPELISALCFVDMDNLKYINDTLGHIGGDIALKSVGYILREYEKKYDGVAGRYGGDEFVLLLPDLDDMEELTGLLDELVLRLHAQIGSNGRDIPVQCSVGVAVCRADSKLEEVIAAADEALYFVKQNGKGYYKIHQI